MNLLRRILLIDDIRLDLPKGFLFIDVIDYRLQVAKRKVHLLFGSEEAFIRIGYIKRAEIPSCRQLRIPLIINPDK